MKRLCKKHNQTYSPEYFEQRSTVDKKTGCWNWNGTLAVNGYGQITISPAPYVRQKRYAHRLSFEAHRPSEFNSELMVLHHCDNRRCVNPVHLFQGTNTDNVNDKVSKERQQRGVKCPGHILVEEEVKEILCSNAQQKVLAEAYGVSVSLISRIKLRQMWKHVSL